MARRATQLTAGGAFEGKADVPKCTDGDRQEDRDRVAELVAAIEAIRAATWKTGQTLPKLRHAIALILHELKKQ